MTGSVLQMFRVVGAVVFFILCSVSPSTARAENTDAKALFERATVQFRLGQFHDAALTYQRVYEIHHDPVLLYNTAQSYRLANEPEKALLFYKSFLSSKPDASNRDEVEGRITELDGIIAEQKRATVRPPNDVTAAPPLPATTTTESPPATVTEPAAAAPAAASASVVQGGNGRGKKIAGGVLLGVAGGALVGGIVTALLSGQASDSINASAKAGRPFDPSKQSAGTTDTIVSGVMFGVAGAAAVAGAVLLGLGVRDGRAHETKVSLLPVVTPSLVGAVAGLRF